MAGNEVLLTTHPSRMTDAKTLVDIFLYQLKNHPDALALKYGSIQLSYRELDEKSNRLAHSLIANGVTNETLVPICLKRPIDMVTGIWGILKAGGAYVPIDADFPAERIKYMISDTGATVVVTDGNCTRFTEAAANNTIISADNDWAEIKNKPATDCNISIGPSDLAYVIYTSGSTGHPKGVLIEHASVMDYLKGLFNHLPYSSCKSFALGVSFAADSVITHVFGSVLAGGALHVFDKEDYNNAEYIHSYFQTHKMDCLKAVPAHWKSLSLNGVELLPRKILMFGGEALYTEIVRDIIPSASRTCITVNHYGPTETTVGQLMHEIDETNTYGHTIPIGKTFTDAVVYILDENGNEVPDGSSGELYIGGICVARGYLNRPELTDQRFVKNKFSQNNEARLYRTGDLVQKLPSGDIEFLGRMDDQVKIRGNRIELGEIENILQKAPGVKQCVVLAAEGRNGDKRIIGYVVCPDGYDKKAILDYMAKKVPDFMVPQLLVPLEELPYFPNGKVDKKALPNPDASTLLTNTYFAPAGKTEQLLSELWKEILGVDRAGADDNFFELGGTSLQALKTVALLKSRHDLHLPHVKLYQYPKLKDLAAFLDGKTIAKRAKTVTRKANTEVAVISMAGRFPGADTIDELWDILKNGRETTKFFTDDELDASISESLKNNPNYVKARGVINDAKGFDASFFGIPPKQAELMDPQQRIFLEIAREALEKAGYVPDRYDGTIGVFAGVRFNTYFANNVLPHDDLIENVGRFQVMTLNDKDYVASRTAYLLDLKGPAVNVQSACSTSLVAIAQAVESIRNGHCDMALAGGASITTPINSGHVYNEGAMLTDDGHCCPFDADAKGTVFSDGAGVVLLKNMEDALNDGDDIIAVIKGIGLNNDGGGKGSFTAPSAEGQADAIRMAIDDAGIHTTDISYIEAHGTATPLGDPIEIEGLNMAFGDQPKQQYCAIGSVKSNFGHLTTAAGVAGFIKTCLSLKNRQLLPSINFSKANPHIDFGSSPFYVNTSLTKWDSDRKRIAGVSSFGVGGTNAHIILSEADSVSHNDNASHRKQLICWSAKGERSLDMYEDKLLRYFGEHTDTNISDVAYTLHTARESFDHRRFIIAASGEDFIAQATNKAQYYAHTSRVKEKPANMVFMFPGQGDQYVNMGKGLYDTELVFRQAMDECAAILKAELNENILDIIYPREVNAAAIARINNTAYSQPALFMIGYALGKLWMNWGIYPTAFVGHSIGEFVAAYFSGIFSLSDALRLIAMRGKMMSALPTGSMLSVRLGFDDIQPYLSADIALAAANSPQLSVVAGATDAINKLSEILNSKEIPNRVLSTSHAFHSHMMDEVVAPFKQFVSAIQLNAPLIPIMSSVTGKWLNAEEATDAGYWAKHLRSTVLFGNAIQHLLDNNYSLFLELGPAKSATTLTRQQAGSKQVTVISSIEKEETTQSSQTSILKALGTLWLQGIEPGWTAFYHNETRRKLTDIPTYAYNKQSYWVDPVPKAQKTDAAERTAITAQAQIQTDADIVPVSRKSQLITQIRQILEQASGIDMSMAAAGASFIELGLDSLLLTQVALLVKKQFSLPITFRQLNEDLGTIEVLANYLDINLPENLLAKHQTVKQPETKDELSEEEKIEIKKPFGAAARIEKQSAALNEAQQQYLAAFTERYNKKTKSSKVYTQQHRAYMADPRVVSGFRPATKELVYSIVIKKSKGSRLWDIDGNEYIDALNGFGSNMLGYQPEVLTNALKEQIDKGYEIGPQHELAGDVCKLICSFTNFDRAALCNTGSEAVLGAMRVARTVTGRSIIVAFAGSYHGITDEVIARGSKKLKTYPASPGIMPEAVQNMLILEYGTEESLQIIEERSHEIAAVLVEPVQSRRCDFQPISFLKKLRKITSEAQTVLIFDEVISGFRFHPGGVQAMFGIKADLGTYGKVVGGGLSIGVIAGQKQFMDALDGGWWQYGDDSIPEAGVTYFAGTFVRHPLVLATAKASLEYFRQAGPQLQEGLNANGQYIAYTINKICRRLQVPIYIAQFGSLWRIRFLEEYPYMELFFTLMRYKGIHIQEGFPCFITAAHTPADIQTIIKCFEESITELKEAGFIPHYKHSPADENKELNIPPIPGAKLGKDKAGNPAWFISDENNPGKYLQVTNTY